MLLRTIVDSLDAELGRLQALRQIVSGISSPTPVDGNMINMLQQKSLPIEGEPSPLPKLLALDPAVNKQGARVGGRLRRQAEPRALATTIPARPVAVPAAQVASERQRRPAGRAEARSTKTKLSPSTSGAAGLPSADVLRNRWLAES